MSTFGQAGGLLNDPSSMSIKTKLGMSDGIRSTKAFMTSVTPQRNINEDLNIGFASDNNSPKGSTKAIKPGRKVFGANAYMERQQKLGMSRKSSPPPANQPPLQKSEFDAEFNAMHSVMDASNKK